MHKEELFVTASLARLELDDAEAEKLNEAISRMIEYFSLMDKIDVEDLPPTTHAAVKENRTRKDEPAGSVLADNMVEAAPEHEGRFITVPNVL